MTTQAKEQDAAAMVLRVGEHLTRGAMWDMLSRFMDVSQPLPDIPRL